VEQEAVLTGIESLPSLIKLLPFWPFVSTALGNFFFFVIITTLLMFTLVSLCLLIKYTPNVLNDFKTITNNEFPKSGIILWLVFIIALPIFFNAGPMWFTLWWFLLLWGYLNRLEKRIVYVFISLIFMSSWIAHIGAGFITYTQTHANKEIFCIQHNLGSMKDTVTITSWAQNNPDDSEPINTMAILELNRDNPEEAINLLGRTLDLEPNNSRFYNHLGIALSRTGKSKKALQAFHNSITLAPKDVTNHYNLSRLYQSTYNLIDAEKSIQRASNLNPGRVRELLDHEAANPEDKYVISRIPVFTQLSRQLRPSSELKTVADALWNTTFGIIKRNASIILAFFCIMVTILVNYRPEEKFTKRCNRCGNMFYAGDVSKSGHPLCLQCHWIATKSKKQMNSIMNNKVEEIKKYRIQNLLQTSKLELILPGLGSFIGDRTVKGVLRVYLFSACLMSIITGGQFLYSFIPSGIDMGSLFRMLGVASLIVLYWRVYNFPPLKYGI